MNSAGLRRKNSQETQKKVFAIQEKENVIHKTTEESNKNTPRHSTGAIKKENYSVKCSYNLRSSISRNPLADINQNPKLKTEQKEKPFDGFKKPAPVSANITYIRKKKQNTFTSPDSLIKSLDTTYYSANDSSQTRYSSCSDDSIFWSSFLTVSNAHSILIPHKKVQKFIRNVEESKTENNFKHNITIHDSIPCLKKRTLKKHLSQSSGYLGVVNLDSKEHKVEPAVLYAIEYMNDIIINIIRKQETNVLKYKLLNQTNEYLNHRASVINWLVKLHTYLHSDAGIFFVAVRIFDKILTLVDIPESNYQLTVIAAYWIGLKYNNSKTDFVGAFQLMELSKNAFTVQSLLEMEKSILLILQYDVVVDDPIIFVYYYIYILQLCESNMIGFCANYLLEILTLDANCNKFSLTLQAASAVFLSLKFFEINEEVWNKIQKYFGYHSKKEMLEVQRIIMKYISLLQEDDCPYKQSFQKYSTLKYGKVSLMIPKILAKWWDDPDIFSLDL